MRVQPHRESGRQLQIAVLDREDTATGPRGCIDHGVDKIETPCHLGIQRCAGQQGVSLPGFQLLEQAQRNVQFRLEFRHADECQQVVIAGQRSARLRLDSQNLSGKRSSQVVRFQPRYLQLQSL